MMAWIRHLVATHPLTPDRLLALFILAAACWIFYLALRPRKGVYEQAAENPALNYNVAIDHCSLTWAQGQARAELLADLAGARNVVRTLEAELRAFDQAHGIEHEPHGWADQFGYQAEPKGER